MLNDHLWASCASNLAHPPMPKIFAKSTRTSTLTMHKTLAIADMRGSLMVQNDHASLGQPLFALGSCFSPHNNIIYLTHDSDLKEAMSRREGNVARKGA